MYYTIKALDKKIREQETKTTYELPCIMTMFYKVNRKEFEKVGLDVEEAEEMFCKMLDWTAYPTEESINGYIMSHYSNICPQLYKVKELYESNGAESRQLVISFPPEHCFQYIQFLFRNDEMLVIGNMRSCDFQKKFVMDTFITYRTGIQLAKILGVQNTNVCVTMNIGSLHIYK